MKRVLFASLALALAGCADSSDEIAASYVSPLAYQDYTCQQLGAEVGRVSASPHISPEGDLMDFLGGMGR